MQIGETRNIVIPIDQAYGPRSGKNILKIGRADFPVTKEPVVGEKVRIGFRGGADRVMLIAGVTENDVTLDANHPLAGLDQAFALTLTAIG